MRRKVGVAEVLAPRKCWLTPTEKLDQNCIVINVEKKHDELNAYGQSGGFWPYAFNHTAL
ncbi:hypothetical protein D3C84_1158320 [compost metagenome]